MRWGCLPGYAFSPLTAYRNRTWHGVRGKGLIFQKNFASGSPEVKGRVKFQVARIELKFGASDARPRTPKSDSSCLDLAQTLGG